MFVEMLAGENKELAEYAARITDLSSNAEVSFVASDFVDALVTERIDKAKKPLQNKINSLEAELEKLRATGRDGKGPSDATAKVAGGSIRNLADADRRYTLPATHPDHITHAQYKAYRESVK
jgi:hypothetical protein